MVARQFESDKRTWLDWSCAWALIQTPSALPSSIAATEDSFIRPRMTSVPSASATRSIRVGSEPEFGCTRQQAGSPFPDLRVATRPKPDLGRHPVSSRWYAPATLLDTTMFALGVISGM